MENRKDNRSDSSGGMRKNEHFDFDTSGLNEVDQHILQLNHNGHSIANISMVLETNYGIKLCKTSVFRHLSELDRREQYVRSLNDS
jgi:hypothetical protein